MTEKLEFVELRAYGCGIYSAEFRSPHNTNKSLIWIVEQVKNHGINVVDAILCRKNRVYVFAESYFPPCKMELRQLTEEAVEELRGLQRLQITSETRTRISELLEICESRVS